MNEILKNIYTWSVYSKEKKINFNGYFLYSEDSTFPNVVIDPPYLNRSDLQLFDSLGSVQHIIITNRNHVRWSIELKEKCNAKISINLEDKNKDTLIADNYFNHDELLFGFLKTIVVPDNKSPGETALYWDERNILFLGDALIGKPSGSVSLLPPEKYSDIKRAKKGLHVLDKLDFDSVLMADGDPILAQGKKIINEFLIN
ncbi:MAG: hypothetical protein CMG74_09665 [Candidatus Marinimicrobia bacterium]|nr:hypothetical protein [Candidatus Neomarinimicrobiota bacterium]|tara:strand:+ start:8922 stop:9524 length:603 start_codon:yes stop_codon:yes gene_type:complete